METQKRSGDSSTPVGGLVNGPAVVVETTTTLEEVARTLGDLGIGMVVVMDKGSIAGMVSERDLIWAIARGAQLDEVWAADIMTKGVVTVEPSLSVIDAAALMASENTRHILVLHGDEPGVVSMTDVIEYLVD